MRVEASRLSKDVTSETRTLAHYLSLMNRVIAQTEARVLRGETRSEGKIVSIFEPHTQVIRKGKLRKPTEFGRLVRIDGIEEGLVSGFEVLPSNHGDALSWKPALENHLELFGRAPHTATADAGYYSAANEKLGYAMGVKRVAIRKKGKLSEERKTLQRSRWFRRAQRWRTGIEAEISILKHPFGMERARYKGEDGFKRHVGASVLAHNLAAIARWTVRQEEETQHAA
jgi:IS5 family transposase